MCVWRVPSGTVLSFVTYTSRKNEYVKHLGLLIARVWFDVFHMDQVLPLPLRYFASVEV